MSYSIKAMLHNYANKNGLHKVYLQVVYSRIPIFVATDYKVRANQYENGEIINHPNKSTINSNLRHHAAGIEDRLIKYLRTGKPKKADLIRICNNTESEISQIKVVDFIRDHNSEMKGKKTDGTLAIFKSLIPDLNEYDPDLTFGKIDLTWLHKYEQFQRSRDWEINTIHKKMSKIKTILKSAAGKDLIEKKKFENYKVPLYIQKIPEYINEAEMDAIKQISDATLNPTYKMAGYYFLLACYAGYRLSDLKKFDHSKYVKGEEIILRAKKNKEIVLVPIHTRLKSILDYVKDHPLTIVEQNLRDDVKELVKLAGIRRHIKIHTGRHSFAMMLMDNGVSLEDVAALLGVSLKTAGIYGRISNKRLGNVVRNSLG